MAKKITIVWNLPAFSQIRKAPGVQADLRRRAQAIANAAGPGMTVHSNVGRNRARAAVVTSTDEARRAEAEHGRLSGSLHAGRG